MADSHAQAGVIASKAGGTAGTTGTDTGADKPADIPKTGDGKVDVAADSGKKPADSDAKPAKTDSKSKETDAKARRTADSTKKVADAAKNLVDTALNEAGKDAGAVGTVKIKMLRSHPEYAYHAGEEGELPADKADLLVEGGFAELVDASDKAE